MNKFANWGMDKLNRGKTGVGQDRVLTWINVVASYTNVFWLSRLQSSRIMIHEETLKWKSQEITNAKTMQASMKLRNRWPCQKRWFSTCGVGLDAATAAAAFASLHSSIDSASFTQTTLLAIDPQISQILQTKRFRRKDNTFKEIM